MIICSCLGISDGDLRESMRGGDSDLAPGSCCGSCMPLVTDTLRKLQEDEAQRFDAEHPAPTEHLDNRG